MAKRRMFNPNIVGSDAFVDMPMSSQALYFHLCLYADDDGFVGRPKQICRMVDANDDDLKILFAKRYLLAFDSGVAVVKHWLIHNSIRADLYSETTYKEEKNTLGLNEFGAYTELRDGVLPLTEIPTPSWLKKRQSSHDSKVLETVTARERDVNGTETARKRHLGKVRLGKVSIEKEVLTYFQKSLTALTNRLTPTRRVRLLRKQSFLTFLTNRKMTSNWSTPSIARASRKT